jgi:hypothetical protein
MFHWLTRTDSGLLLRVAVGVAVFTVLAIADLQRAGRAGRAATRWREYAFLLVCVAAAVAYGVVNDQITSSISWEYFYYGKELDQVLGPAVPPDGRALHLQAAKIGAEATWSAGLIFGVVLLFANNPRPGLPRLSNRELLRQLPVIAIMAALCGAIMGWLGYNGSLVQLQSEFAGMVSDNLYHPHRFMCAWGVHLGGYMGGAIGTILSASRVIRLRSLRRGAVI